mgnify:CR=1 FL=1
MHRVFVDSNVLGSKTLYDWLFLLRKERPEMFHLVTTDDVLDEAHRVWRRRHPETGGAMRARREELFRTNFNEITSDWKGQTAPVVDVDDSHVHNAASDLKADILLTDNVKDLGDPDGLPYDLYTPDEFFCLIYENEPNAVREVVAKQVDYWHRRALANKDRQPKKLADALVDAGCLEFAKNVHECLLFVSGLQQTDL